MLHLRRASHSSARVAQVVAGASQSTVGELVALWRRNSTGFLLDSTKVEAAITTTTSICASVSAQVAVGEETGSSADEFGGLWRKDGLAESTVLETVEGVAATATTIAVDQLWVAGRSHRVDDTVAGLLNTHCLREGRSKGQHDGHEQFHLKTERERR